jgi:hypothetical protein
MAATLKTFFSPALGLHAVDVLVNGHAILAGELEVVTPSTARAPRAVRKK